MKILQHLCGKHRDYKGKHLENIENKSKLLNQLDNIVDTKHINEVKKVIDALSKINEFKYSISESKTTDDIYSKIKYVLENNFQVTNFKILQAANNIETIKFQTHENNDQNYSFKNDVCDNRTIEFKLNHSHLDEFDKIYLDNYLQEIIHILYIQLVLGELQTTSLIDPLTKLKTRMSFNEEMLQIEPLARREKMNIGVLLINIDRFRAVNDEHGIQFGDEFLKLYANTLKTVIRDSDIAVRFGGGEFLVLLMNVSDEQRTMLIANNIQEKLNNTHLLTQYNDEFKKTVSIGVSMFPCDAPSITQVVKNSELALSDAKDIGRSQIIRFKEDTGDIDLF
ncbi:MAG TPA: GGDEF domain-containing protein [Arcobacter sp.]|nr:GGDEF domain-containing protein [Arcobacter sp.]